MWPMPLSLHTGFCFLNSHDSPSQSFGSTQWGKIFLKEHCILIFTKICIKLSLLQHKSNKKSRSFWKFLIFQPITGQLSISCPVIVWKTSNYLSDTFWTCIFIEEIYKYISRNYYNPLWLIIYSRKSLPRQFYCDFIAILTFRQ